MERVFVDKGIEGHAMVFGPTPISFKTARSQGDYTRSYALLKSRNIQATGLSSFL